MLTEAQKVIIREICLIQFEALENVLGKVDLGQHPIGQSYEELFIDLGITRKEFDEELKLAHKAFKKVNENPEEIYRLQDLDLLTLRYILNKFNHKWETRFPKALHNLWQKLYVWESAISTQN